jgi:hypothetical protein
MWPILARGIGQAEPAGENGAASRMKTSLIANISN